MRKLYAKLELAMWATLIVALFCSAYHLMMQSTTAEQDIKAGMVSAGLVALAVLVTVLKPHRKAR